MTAAPIFNPPRMSNHAALEVIEGRVALKIAGTLNESSQLLHPDIGERLRFARETALAAASQRHKIPAVQQTGLPAMRRIAALAWSPSGGSGHKVWQDWKRALSMLIPALALALGLVAADAWQTFEQVQETADVDELLLSDTLPPEAYGDPGFVEFSLSPTPRPLSFLPSPSQ